MQEARSNLKQIFGEALGRSESDRAAYLESACGGDAVLRAQVEELLASAEKPDPFLSEATMDAVIREPKGLRAEVIGAHIGPYKLLEEIGEGGFGSVFMAEQERPVRRLVALKIIKLGMDTRAVVGRFEQERQALAIMDHPHIAKVLDAGATETGRPYFVMELVKGEAITTYCDKHNLTIPERLRLFTQVCQAVQHAHTKGVIHRDIKPSNILVTSQDGEAHARVIDFGIAKATNHRMTEKTMFTEFRQLIGTPEYMSPEQTEGGMDIDTRTDVYSLGVLLYELLTGSTPFDSETLRSAAFGEIQRIIREVEPPKPSTRLHKSAQAIANVAAHRKVEPAKLGTIIRGELDWIVMKALEKDRGRRYDSAGNLASDIQRYLAGDSISAAPPSTAYRFRKFVRRNRLPVIAASLIGLALVLGVAGTAAGMLNARASRDRAIEAEKLARQRLDEAEKARTEAERSFKIASAVTEFFTLDVLDLQPTPPGQPDVTVRELLARVPEKIQQHFSSEPAVEGAIRERVGQLYLGMGEPRKAAEFLEPAAALLERGLGPEAKGTLMAQQRLGELMLSLERFADAEMMFDKVYQTRQRVFGDKYTLTLNSLSRRGTARVHAGKMETGIADEREASNKAKEYWGQDSKPALIMRKQLIDDLRYSAAPEAEQMAREVLNTIRAHPAELSGAEPDFRMYLGLALAAQSKHAEAIPELDAAWQSISRDYPASHPKVVDLRIYRGETLAALDRGKEAAVELRTAYETLEPVYGSNMARCRSLARELADLATKAGDHDTAATWRRRQ